MRREQEEEIIDRFGGKILEDLSSPSQRDEPVVKWGIYDVVRHTEDIVKSEAHQEILELRRQAWGLAERCNRAESNLAMVSSTARNRLNMLHSLRRAEIEIGAALDEAINHLILLFPRCYCECDPDLFGHPDYESCVPCRARAFVSRRRPHHPVRPVPLKPTTRIDTGPSVQGAATTAAIITSLVLLGISLGHLTWRILS